MPFATTQSRDKHYLRHGHKVGATDALHYEEMADAFIFDAMNADTHQCSRPNGNRVRLDFVTRDFGVGVLTGVVVTFYPVEAVNIANRGGAQNYFTYQCGRDI